MFRSWDRLGRWISESAEELLLRTDLRDAAAGWKSRRQPADELWVGTRLAQARDRLQPASALDDESREFLDAALEAERYRNETARAAEQRLRDATDRRRRRLLVGVSGVAAVFALLSVVATGFFIQSRRNAHEARLATQAATENAQAAEAARAGEAKSAQDAHDARDVAVQEKARAVESLFQGLGLNIGKDQYPGSICTEPDAGCTFGSEISGLGSWPSAAATVTVLGALDETSVQFIGPTGTTPDSRDFVVASEWGEGRVIGYAHDGLISDTAFRNCPKDEQSSISDLCAQGVTQADRADNLTFVDNALRWVHNTASCNSGTVQVAIFEGFQTRQNTSEIADLLTTRDWSYQPLDPTQPLSPQLECASALVWGNPWDEVSDEQLRDVVEYVRNGGGLLLGGLGWSWRDFSGSAMADYPSSRLAAVFGFGFTTDAFQPAATVRVLPATGS